MTSATYLYIVLALAGIIAITQIIRAVQNASQLAMGRKEQEMRLKLMREQIKMRTEVKETNDE